MRYFFDCLWQSGSIEIHFLPTFRFYWFSYDGRPKGISIEFEFLKLEIGFTAQYG